MSNFLFTADFHLTSRPCDEYRWGIFPWLAILSCEKNINAIFILGDLTDKKDNHDSKLVNRIVDEFAQLSQDTPIWFLTGNHDYVDPDNPFFGFLDNLEDISVIKHPLNFTIDGKAFLFLPHTREHRHEWGHLDFKKSGLRGVGNDYILLHQAVTGARAENGFAVEGVSPNLFSKQKTNARVIAGDIHVPQKIGNVTYCGAPHPIKFGDAFNPRVLLADDEGIQSIERSTIKKLKLTITKPDELFEHQLCEGDQIKVVLELPRSEYADWDNYKAEIAKNANQLGVVLHGCELKERVRVRLGEQPKEKAKNIDTKKPDEVVSDFCKSREIETPIAAMGRSIVKDLQ